MRLVIGGYAQGKLDYVLERYGILPEWVSSGQLPVEAECPDGPVVIDRLHQWGREQIEKGEKPEENILQFVERHPDCILICDEIGNGIVPAEAKEREYRERTGRILVELAGRAEAVERIVCGIAQKIK